MATSMAFWNKILGRANKKGDVEARHLNARQKPIDSNNWAIVDVEVGIQDNRIHDIGALCSDGSTYHGGSIRDLMGCISEADYLCGHNIINHDIKYLFGDKPCDFILVDTLFMSPILFPNRPYHRLVKDDKLFSEQMNNPLNDCEKARDLLMDEISTWASLPEAKQRIFATLLYGWKEFAGFMRMVDAKPLKEGLPEHIQSTYKGQICSHADVKNLIDNYPCELAYALALVDTSDYRSVTPGWVLHNFPNVEHVIKLLRQIRCKEGCAYCNKALDVHYNLKKFFGYDQFRTYEGEPLQELAADAATKGKSLLAIFPTGGGKSITFQLPALMAGRSVRGLTVVISPLQSLMKDQVDNLAEKGMTDAVTINGLLDPISRALSIKRVLDGDASLLYIAPEMLRSKTIERILIARQVVRFVIDEAHCFSAWGQDFRVDYLYIGKFIRDYQKKKNLTEPIPVSCFTATAKQKVIQDIRDYFQKELGIYLELFATSASRSNLHYSVIHSDTDDDKYAKLRSIIAEADCPTIVYVSRTKRTLELAKKLTRDGYRALPFNGKMDSEMKIANQDAFMSDEVRIIVATSAFGMGVDKKDVGLVVHYDISDSLENYVQEAGRAGRDPSLNAKCFVLYSEGDLDKHFMLLNQTKLSISEIQQVWRAVKAMTRQKNRVCCSALEIARQAGWNDTVSDIETRVRTALSALERSGYIERGNNIPHVYATGITVKNVEEARQRISESILFDNEDEEKAVRIIQSLISEKHIAKSQNAESESRIDYLADILGLKKSEVVSAVERMRQEGILADTKDITAYLLDGESALRSKNLVERFARLEKYILENIPSNSLKTNYRQINEKAVNSGINSSKEKDIRTILYFQTIKNYIHKSEDSANNVELKREKSMDETMSRFHCRIEICKQVVEWLYQKVYLMTEEEKKRQTICFSVVELLSDVKSRLGTALFVGDRDIQLEDVEEALLYLSKIGALKLEGGFLVLYNAMDIHRLQDNRIQYKLSDYRMLDEFYKQKIQQIHIVGEYANLMVKNYDAALQYVQDYFQMDYKRFVSKYFKGDRVKQIDRNVTPEKYERLFGALSDRQLEIINDKSSRAIVVAAGPGSGKTRVLVHKLASLLQLEDVKHEQLLMLTFSRAAATEFKERLIQLIGTAAHYVEIKTFHSYCFDLLGRIGNLEDAENVVAEAAEMISKGDVEQCKIGKTVLVIDEAQDMGEDEFALLTALMKVNEEMRIIAVGDDDQNIYQFRGSSSMYMGKLVQLQGGGKLVEMTENYRSDQHVVRFANAYVKTIFDRMKRSQIVSKSDNVGWVHLTQHRSKYMYIPLANQLQQNLKKGDSACVLTQTNEEAVILVALLRKRGINSKLIHSLDGFKFWNIAEMRFFVKFLEKRLDDNTFITDELWEDAKETTCRKYAASESLSYVRQCLNKFETVSKAKYLTDFKEFIFESSVEDFCDGSGADVVVSTIHKAKGREFDDVYMLVNNSNECDDNLKRRYYVGMTRAKKRLFIHTNSNLFDGLPVDKRCDDVADYPMPDEIVLQMSLKDVYLDFFKPIKKEVLSLRSGYVLSYANYTLFDPKTNMAVCRLSEKMQNEVAAWEEKAYVAKTAKIRFIVAWKSKKAPKDESESAVLLADIVLTKNG